jgi:hypothetical protein
MPVLDWDDDTIRFLNVRSGADGLWNASGNPGDVSGLRRLKPHPKISEKM